MKLSEIFEGHTISFADPDHDPKIAAATADAEYEALKRREESAEALVDLSDALGGDAVAHRSSITLYGRKTPTVRITGLEWKGGKAAIGTGFRNDQVELEIRGSKIPWGRAKGADVAKAMIVRMGKKHGFNLHGTDLTSNGNDVLTGVVLGYTLKKSEVKAAKAFIEEVLEYAGEF
jgi:hypothetical protein